MTFEQAYKQLNPEQKQAVDTIDGPLLVLAGPGTGKTQLLSARVANILKKTDTLPESILCLTFTESAARNMRERLASMIGEAAYDVHMSTYHSFGSDIIKTYPQFFSSTHLETGEETRMERPIDDLTKTSLIRSIIALLPYDDPLKSATYYVKSVVSTISELKRGLLTPEKLVSLAKENIQSIESTTEGIQAVFGNVSRVPAIKKALPLFEALHSTLAEQATDLPRMATLDIKTALETAALTGKTTSLTAFKKKWLHKTAEGTWELTGREASEKIASLANIFDAYQKLLAEHSQYDFDDMILRAIQAMHTQPELRYELQETYQYILLDEFQDTNASQFELVKLLADNPVHEGRPNVMAVGDDDQAIYAFQGADIGNMQAFTKAFRNVNVINLVQNYRSHTDILHTAHNVAQQIESRLHHSLAGITKTLEAASTSLSEPVHIERHEFTGEASEYAWVAEKIASLHKAGTPLSHIAVLAPKHALLERLVAFLNKEQLPVAYEKRENILHTKLVISLKHMSELVLALQAQNNHRANELFPVVLSLEFWHIPVEEIWSVNWQLTRQQNITWAELALKNDQLKEPVRFFLQLSMMAPLQSLEYMLDYLCGSEAVVGENVQFTSPFKAYYFNSSRRSTQPNEYFQMISHLSVIRSRLRDYQTSQDSPLLLKHFIEFLNMYDDAEEPLINSHPLAQAEEAVELMTVYKAKGLEFTHVFLLSMQDDVWGKKARSNSNKIGLPPNLQHIRYQGSSEDELKRLLFVAITRAKRGLFLTSHAMNDAGKPTEYVKYLQESKEDNVLRSGILPVNYQIATTNPFTATSTEDAVEALWQDRHTRLQPSMQGLLKDRLSHYRMSPTHLNTFIDTEFGGPEAFLLRTLLRFPQAPTPESEFGNAIHATLDWYQKQLTGQSTPSLNELLTYFDTDIARRYIEKGQVGHLKTKGRHALQAYVKARKVMFAHEAMSEVDFSRDGIVIDGRAHISGKIDRLEINKDDKTITVIDFKTGKGVSKWPQELKYLKYRQQLYLYKLLIEGSHRFRGYQVTSGRLEFVEPDPKGNILPGLELVYDNDELEKTKRLLLVVWDRIQTLQFDDISNFKPDYKGATAFIDSLLSEPKS